MTRRNVSCRSEASRRHRSRCYQRRRPTVRRARNPGGRMTGETEEMVIPTSWLQRLSKSQVRWLLGAAVSIGSFVSIEVYTHADTQRRLASLEQEMRQQVKEQGDRNERQLVTLTQLTERISAISERFATVDARLASIDRSVKVMAQ